MHLRECMATQSPRTSAYPQKRVRSYLLLTHSQSIGAIFRSEFIRAERSLFASFNLVLAEEM